MYKLHNSTLHTPFTDQIQFSFSPILSINNRDTITASSRGTLASACEIDFSPVFLVNLLHII